MQLKPIEVVAVFPIWEGLMAMAIFRLYQSLLGEELCIKI